MSKDIFTRRDFLRSAAAGAATVSAAASQVLGAAAPAAAPSVLILRDQGALADGYKVDPAVLKKMLADTLIRITGERSVKSAWLSLVQPTDTIGLVPTPHLNPTHRELVDAVRESLIEAGIPEGRIRNAQGSPEAAKVCTALIPLPALKAHWLTGIGTVLKNYIMYSGSPSNYHHQDSRKLGEIWNMPHVKGKTRLILVDALRPLCDKGPQPDPRYMWAYNGLIAGQDPVAVESVCLKIITEKREALRGEPWPLTPPPLCVKDAEQRYNLGIGDLQKIRIQTAGWAQDLLL